MTASGRAGDATVRSVNCPAQALVAATAAEHGITLATRDRRAAETYRALDVDFELIDIP
jgi:predicted nucleic acid-binding protein